MNSFIKKITLPISLFTIASSLIGCAPTTPEVQNKKIIDVTKTVFTPSGTYLPFSVAHYEDEPEVLFIEMNYAISELIDEFVLGMSDISNITREETSTTFKLTRENGAFCEIDFEKDIVYFNDYDKFNQRDFSSNAFDLLGMSYVDELGNNKYIKRDSYFYIPGNSLTIDLTKRNIPLEIYNGKKYIPIQTFNDFFVNPHGFNVVYNGYYLFILIGNALTPGLDELYYATEKTDRTKFLAEFNYNELCLYLDINYGLAKEHGINNGFDTYLSNIGLKDEFLKLDPIYSFKALVDLTLNYISDFHTSIVGGSSYLTTPIPTSIEDMITSFEQDQMVEMTETYKDARAKVYNEVSFYEEAANTAFITFDEFTIESRVGNYETEKDGMTDTLSIIYKSHELISQNPNIKNIVLDLSCNSGGAVDAAVYVVSWLLGYCDFSINNPITGSKGTTRYVADVNLDGKFDEKDNVSDKNIYCLISPVSFSCGNYVPALLKDSGKVTILGKRSSGGTSVVRNAATADGSFFSLSSAHQMSVVDNGSYYNVDRGVEPHYELSKIDSFYNRYELAQYINSILK